MSISLIASAPIGYAAASRTVPSPLPDRDSAAINRHISELSLEIIVPERVVKGDEFYVCVQALIPPSLQQELGARIDTLVPGHPQSMPEIPVDIKVSPRLSFTDPKPDLVLDTSQDRENRTGYYLKWTWRASAKQTGKATIEASLAGLTSRKAKATVDIDTGQVQVARGIFERNLEPIRWALLLALFIGALTISDLLMLFLDGTLSLLLLADRPIALFVGALVLLTLVCLNRVTNDSAIEGLMIWRRRKNPTPAPAAISIKDLKERAERITDGAVTRARLQLLLGVGMSLGGFAAAAFLLSVDHFPLPDTKTLLLSNMPLLMILIASQLGARFFLQEYRNSLNDHRYFEQHLRDREWQDFVLEGTVADEKRLDKLLALYSPPKRSREDAEGDADKES